MPRFAPLMPMTAADLEINFENLPRKRKFDSDSKSPSSCSSSMELKENTQQLDDFLAKKRTNPVKYCPRRRPATQQAPPPASAPTQPGRTITKAEDDEKLKQFLQSRPHFRTERLPEATESQDMAVLKAFRRQDFLAAQEAKKNGGFKEEPKPKKKARSTSFSLPLIGIRDDASSEFVGVGLRDHLALPRRRVEKSTESPFCLAHRQTYDDYCSNFWTDRPQRLQTALFTFCPGYENKCLH